VVDNYGRTPADIAREKGHLGIASLIEQYGMAPIKSANFNI
jgi:hypothetical protein